jgi:hypothetical protein
MGFFFGMLLAATAFFGLCFYNLTCKVYDFVVGIGDAYERSSSDIYSNNTGVAGFPNPLGRPG